MVSPYGCSRGVDPIGRSLQGLVRIITKGAFRLTPVEAIASSPPTLGGRFLSVASTGLTLVRSLPSRQRRLLTHDFHPSVLLPPLSCIHFMCWGVNNEIRSEEEMRRGTHGSLPLGRSGDGYGQASGEAGRQSNPVTAAAVHAVAAQVAAHAAAVVTNRPDWRNPWHDSWRGGGGPGIGGVPGFAAAALASGGLSSLVSPEGDDQGDDEVKPSETADPRNALSNMLDEDPSERRCDILHHTPYPLTPAGDMCIL